MTDDGTTQTPQQAALAAWRAAGNKVVRKTSGTHTIRSKDGGTIEIPNYTPREACARMCMECLCWDGDPRKDCTDPLCPLTPHRDYRRPA